MTSTLNFFRSMMLSGIACAGMLFVIHTATAQGDEADNTKSASEEAARRSAAVTLNYSRASFHRIRRNPTLRVLGEEQEKILNHLNLNGVADEEVLKLYSSVLDEISQIQLADRERVLLRGKHNQQLQANLGFSALALTTQMATAQFASAVRTGAASWWDVRNFSTNRDLDLHRIDKDRMTKLVEKSAKFLDVSWKMARDKQIPDRWLVRGDDLDKLEEAWKEPDPTTRHRVLKRMEPFMECYPPYWYYLARTEQALGRLPTAAKTFQQMASLGEGHFRKDEMLSAGLANQALIQAYLEDPAASETARRALACSNDVWEANLLCASVLQRSGAYEDAEDAILRNLDVDLEVAQSRAALVTLYVASDNREKLTAMLSDFNIVRTLPTILLTQCAAALGETNSPPLLAQVLERSLQATPRYNLGRDDLVIQATSNWQLEHARIRLAWDEGAYINPRLTTQGEHTVATFEAIGEFSALGQRPESRELQLTIEYPDAAPLQITLRMPPGELPANGEGSSTLLSSVRRPGIYRIAGYQQDKLTLAVQNGIVRNLSKPESPQLARPLENKSSTTLPVGITTFKPVTGDDPYFITPEIELPQPKGTK